MSETRDIQRYSIGGLRTGIEPDSLGGWVRHADHNAELLRLRTENATLKAECGAWRAWCEWGIHVTAGENDDVDDTTARHWKDVEAARTATNQLCPEWAKENP